MAARSSRSFPSTRSKPTTSWPHLSRKPATGHRHGRDAR
jgi:hypothetical protein